MPILKQPWRQTPTVSEPEENRGPAKGLPPPAVIGVYRITDEEFRTFRRLIHEDAGISLSEAKRQLVCSRLTKRLRHFGFQTFRQYYNYLMTQDHDGTERLQMINCLTTNKTEFFREGHHFDFLRKHVFPWVRRRLRLGEPKRLRLWSAGCSSGEEAYSLAITVQEEFGELPGWDIKILASDVATNVLHKAEAGLYAEESLTCVPQVLRRKYFLQGQHGQSDGVCVRPELQEMITFRRINFIADSWPIHTQFDAIFCRNVAIYFDRNTQRRLFNRLAEYLLPGGYLFVGHSESLLGLADQVVPLHGTVYRLRTGQTDLRVTTW